MAAEELPEVSTVRLLALVVPPPVVAAVGAGVLLAVDRRPLAGVDYPLLGTFAGFFIFIGNLSAVPAFRQLLAAVLDELRRIEAGQGVNGELLDTIQMIATIMNGMQEDFAYDR